MLEYTDKIGKVKVINVTEARANFATVLSDDDSFYIITKNNKPKRVIITYEDFEILKKIKNGEDFVLGNIEERPKKEVSAKQEKQKTISKQQKTTQKVSEKNEVSGEDPVMNSALKGLLASRVEQSQNKKEPIKHEIKQDDTKNKIDPDELQRQIDALTLSNEEDVLSNDSENYFLTSDDDLDDLNENISSVESQEPKNDELSAVESDGDEQEISDVVEEEEFIIEEPQVDNMEHDLDFTDENQTNPIEEDIEKQMHQNEDSTDTTAKMRTPEEEEYFKKYRKLYEKTALEKEASKEDQKDIVGVELENNENEKIEVEMQNVQNSTVTFEDQSHQKVPEKNTISELKSLDSSKKIENTINEKSISEKSIKIERVVPEQVEEDKNEDLPSLQELLKDLDDENLIGSDEYNLEDDDINDLITRLNND